LEINRKSQTKISNDFNYLVFRNLQKAHGKMGKLDSKIIHDIHHLCDTTRIFYDV